MGEAKQGVDVMVANTNGGIIMPTYVVLEFNKSIATTSSVALANTHRVRTALEQLCR